MLALADAGAVVITSLSIAPFAAVGLDATLWALLSLPLWIICAKVQGLYDRDHRALRHLTVDELPSLIVWAMVGTAAMALLLLGPVGAIDLRTGLTAFAVALVSVFVLRSGGRALWRRLAPAERTLLVGSGPHARAVRRKLEVFPDIHAHVVRVRRSFDLDESAEELADIDRVIFAAESVEDAQLLALLAVCRQSQIKLSAVLPMSSMFGATIKLAFVADLPLVEYSTWGVSRSTLLLKRLVDVVAAAAGLIVLSPFLVLTALAIYLDTRGRILFAQTRAGLGGTPFRIYKFRTMVADAEAMLEDVVRLDGLPEPVFKLRDDPRVTRVGRIIRRTSLDELPQLVNVLKGDMSLVGPRPEQVELVGRYTPEERIRLAVKPGMTGPMQVFGRGNLTLEERLALEREYVENLSLGRDLHILALTLPAVIAGAGAY